MVTTRKLSESLKKDLDKSAAFRRALLGETMTCMASGDVETGKIVLREYINGTIGFVTLGKTLHKSPKSLMRMLSSDGNPHIRNLFEIIAYLLKIEGTALRFEAVDIAA